jgi:glycosyltransferase involved in cell wall biosynthesis
LRIAWFSPYCRDSAIGRFSDLVVRQLATEHHVTLWVPDLATNRTGPVETIPVQSCTTAALNDLESYDLAVYNLGNDYPYHGLIHEFSTRRPGLVILHDLVLHHLFASLYLEHRHDPGEYLTQLRKYYGDAATQAAESALAGTGQPIWETEDVSRWPLFEPTLEGALGVVTHSEFARERVTSRFAGPVFRLYLPYDRGNAEGDAPVSRKQKLLLLSLGHVNRNKRTHAVLNVLAARPDLCERLRFVILGPVDPTYKAECDAIIAAGGLRQTAEFLGRVDDATLDGYLADADICVNLRYPVTETGSASLAEEMLHGKPVIVTNIGCYADVPDDAVRKVNPAREHEDLQRVLSELVSIPESRAKTGANAKAFAEAHFSPALYARQLGPIFEEVCSAAPLLSCIDRVGDVLSAMGVTRPMKISDTISEEFTALFGDATG